MKVRLTVIIAAFSTFSVAQVDTKKSVPQSFSLYKIPKKDPVPADTPIKPTIEYKSIFDKDNQQSRYSLFNTKKESKSILENSSNFKNPGENYLNALNDKNSEKPILDRFRRDQFLGEFKLKSKFVRIVCHDHEYPDGDLVQILLNDKIIISNILLESTPREYFLNLENGFNKIEFRALNEGTSSPNTAAFKVYDEKGVLVTSNEWNLTTGVKAKIVIVNQE